MLGLFSHFVDNRDNHSNSLHSLDAISKVRMGNFLIFFCGLFFFNFAVTFFLFPNGYVLAVIVVTEGNWNIVL